MDRSDDSRALECFLANRDAACPACGYNLRGLTAEACPECRHELELQIVPIDRPSTRRVRLFLLLAAVSFARGLFGAIAMISDMVRPAVPISQNLFGLSLSTIWVCMYLWLAFIGASGAVSIFLLRDTPACGKAVRQFSTRALIYLGVSLVISLGFQALRLW